MSKAFKFQDWYDKYMESRDAHTPLYIDLMNAFTAGRLYEEEYIKEGLEKIKNKGEDDE